MEETEKPNIIVSSKSNKTNKILVFVLIFSVVVTAVLVFFYLKNQQVMQKAAGPATGRLILTKEDGMFTYPNYLDPGTLNKSYETIVEAGIYNLNVQINGEIVSGLPSGLKIISCSTEYNSSQLASVAPKNSLCKCIIGGTPKESGRFDVKISFSIQNGVDNISMEVPFIVNQQ